MDLDNFLAIFGARAYGKFQEDMLLRRYEPQEGLKIVIHRNMSYEDATKLTSHEPGGEFNIDDVARVSTQEKGEGDFVGTLFGAFTFRNFKTSFLHLPFL